MSQLRIAVVGYGHLGRIHARLLRQNPNANLVAVADPDPTARDTASKELGVDTVADFHHLIGRADAAIVAAPTGSHHALASQLLEAGMDVLVEKPLTPGSDAARGLHQLATQQGRVLAVGHVEQFNPAFRAAKPHLQQPHFVEASRCTGFSFRSMDVGVILDLMIHDLELVLALVASPVDSVEAWGCTVVSRHEDIAIARLRFNNGCVANFTASRVSPDPKREMLVYTDRQHARIDFANRTARLTQVDAHRDSDRLAFNTFSTEQIDHLKDRVFTHLLPTVSLPVADSNPLADEQQDFIDSIRQGRPPLVGGDRAASAVQVANLIASQLLDSPQPRLHRPAA